MTPRPTRDAGHDARSSSRAEDQADGAADTERAEAGHLHLENQQARCRTRSAAAPRCSPAGSETRRTPAAGTTPPTTPGAIAPGIPEFDGEPEQAERHQQVRRSAGARSRSRNRCRRVISIDAPGRPSVRTVTVRPSKRVTVRPSSCVEQIVDILRDEVDERRRGVQRLAVGERAARQHGFGRERYVAPARLGQRPRIRGRIRRRLLRHRRHPCFSPEPETGCAAPACVAGAMAATSAAIRRMNPADAARAPDGATNTTTGVRAVIIRDTMLRVESSRPPGVRNTSTTSSAPDVSAASIASMKYSAVIGWMMPSISVTMTLASGRCRLRPRRRDDAAERDRRSNERQARHGGPIVRRAYRRAARVSPRAVDLELLHCARFPPNFRRATC